MRKVIMVSPILLTIQRWPNWTKTEAFTVKVDGAEVSWLKADY